MMAWLRTDLFDPVRIQVKLSRIYLRTRGAFCWTCILCRSKPSAPAQSREEERVNMLFRPTRLLAVGLALHFLVSVLQSQAANTGYPIPQPKYEVSLEKSVMISMRDGIKLSTDLYFPQGLTGPLPTVLIRTPYNKNPHRVAYFEALRLGRDPQARRLKSSSNWRENPAAYIFASRGYVVAVQDMRGRFESEGSFIISAADRKDGSDTVTWLAGRPWSNGKVGTYGCSYGGENQLQLATQLNPHHAAAIPQAAGGASRYFGVYLDGVLDLAAALGWFGQQGSKVFLRPPHGVTADFYATWGELFNPAPQVPVIEYEEILPGLPVLEMLKKAGVPPTDWEDVVSHPPSDPWWDALGYVNESDSFDIPALHVNSWYDIGVADTLWQFNLMRENAKTALGRDNQFVVISPMLHCQSERATEETIVGERNVGDARLDYWGLYLQWFDHWLKGIDNGVEDLPKVRVFVMGRNQWRSASQWPVPAAESRNYFLHSNGAANSLKGDGTLGIDRPADEPADQFIYDPDLPVPSIGGPGCCNPYSEQGSFDQRQVEMRQDILVYTSEPLEEGLEVTGPIELTLFVSSNAADTDFTAKLIDVDPEGRAFNVQEGIKRMRYRQGLQRVSWITPGQVYEIRIDLQATSNFFGPGHKIRLEVSSSNFPRFVRNLNTKGDPNLEITWEVAANTVHHSKMYPSRLVLPVILQ